MSGVWEKVAKHIIEGVRARPGKNRYMGGENASSLNVDFALPDATLESGGEMIVDAGTLVA